MSNLQIIEALQVLEIEGWVLDNFDEDGNKININSETLFNANFKRQNGVDENNTATYSTEPSDFGITWSQITSAIGNGGAVSLAILRKQRNQLLVDTDWTQSTDNGLTDSKKAEWVTYRQALRDLPSSATPTLSDDGLSISNVTFPTQPS
tara:strand:+ start:531 stop:980 length:450 start_codon:yes stop_codon:yes gene_type:complete